MELPEAQALRRLVTAFLVLLREGCGTPEQDERILERLLDAIAAARHAVAYTFDAGEHPEPPEWPYEERRALVAQRFPRYGHYNVASPVSERVGDGNCNVGDALDDIADIAGELADVEWCWEHTSEADALWRFENGFQFHWGQHLRELQSYLCALRHGR